MKKILLQKSYCDEDNNRIIVADGCTFENVRVVFNGKNNTLIISNKNELVSNIKFKFPADSGICIVGGITAPNQIHGSIKVGYNSLVVIGDNVTSTNPILISCVEETQVLIGDDCMFASLNHIRTDDAHAIYDVITEKRVNPSKDIIIGAHTWVAYAAKIYGGGNIGDGCVVGLNSIVKGKFPNNCTIVGAPAKIVRKNIAWERPNMSTKKPWVRKDATEIDKSNKYWNETKDEMTFPVLGESFMLMKDLLQKYCPDSIWLQRNDKNVFSNIF